jgi:hypothetical protein
MEEVTGLSQQYACLWTKEQIDEWVKVTRLPRDSR